MDIKRFVARSRTVVLVIFIFAINVSLMSACQTTGFGTTPGTSNSGSNFRVAKDLYTIFYDQKDHLNELLTTNQLADASILYEEQRAWFDANAKTDPAVSTSLATLATRLNAEYEPAIKKALDDVRAASWPSPPSSRPDIRKALDAAQTATAAAPKNGLYINETYRPATASELKSAADALRAKINETSVADFKTFDFTGDVDFFAIHPTGRSASAFFSAQPKLLEQTLAGRSGEAIKNFAAKIGKENFDRDQWKAVSNAYAGARISSQSTKNQSLADILSVYDDAKDAGFDVDKLPSVNIGFIEVTSQSLLKEGQIDFPAAISVDLPVDISKSELEKALTSTDAAAADYLIVFDVALAKAKRRVGKMKSEPSELIVGYRQQPNPDYARLQTSLSQTQMAAQNASMNVAMAQSQYCYGLACLANAISVAAAASKRDEAQASVAEITNRLSSTSLTVDVPIKQPYSYKVGPIAGTKTMTVHYYVIDKSHKQYFKSTFDVVENRSFDVAYQVQDSDPNKDTNIAKHQNEADVSAWEKEPSTVKLSQLISHYLKNEKKAQRLPELAVLQREMLADRNKAIAQYKANTFKESTANDPRFDSVVVIYMPDGGLGSGFFVKPDVVMTNYHVVEEGEFTNLKMHDGQETFGKVIARDAGIDLALIKVQSRGKPVRFFNQNKIELGSTVEVIGHPRRYEFSITRGVVSAIRDAKSTNLRAGPNVLHVQIDAATSPGNSGGPVFLKDYVISVVSWGRVDRGSENLNFTIHHSEAQRFLRESLGGN